MKTTTKWKFLHKKGRSIVSEHGDTEWKIGEWQHVDGPIKACYNGFHASEMILDAFGYVQGDILAKVEVKGECAEQSDKAAYSDMRIVEAYKWTKEDSVRLAIYSAEQVIKIYEKQYPNDSRPRDAIKAAKAYLKEPNKKNQDAAGAAYAAAYAAARAADAAAYAAGAAGAAAYAAYAARAAGAAAYAAAYAAAGAEMKAKVDRWCKARVKKLEKLK